jgi:hypothetical protein
VYLLRLPLLTKLLLWLLLLLLLLGSTPLVSPSNITTV